MAEEIQEAVQIIRVGYDGIEIAMKLGGASIEQIKKFAGFLFAVMDHEKAMGKTNMRNLLVKGGDLQHKCELKQAILVKLLYETHHSDFFGTVFFLTDNVNIFYLQN